jgi:hypothetical protein
MIDLEWPEAPLITYGESGPLLYRVGHQILVDPAGGRAEHWVLVRSYMATQPLYSAPVAPAIDPGQPCAGDTIMVLKREWLDLILNKGKVLELRHIEKVPGRYWLGHNGWIHGVARTLQSYVIKDMADFRRLLPMHRLDKDRLPYEKTCALPLTDVVRLPEPVPYVHHQGAVGWCLYEAPGLGDGDMSVSDDSADPMAVDAAEYLAAAAAAEAARRALTASAFKEQTAATPVASR